MKYTVNSVFNARGVNKLFLFLLFIMTIAVDSRVPGNRDECPFPQAKQCSPQLGSPSLPCAVRLKGSFSSKYTNVTKKPIVTAKLKNLFDNHVWSNPCVRAEP